MNEVLIDLENNHFISYNHETVGRAGKHGRYKELYWVNYIAENSKLAFGETMNQDKPKELPQSDDIMPYDELMKIQGTPIKISSRK